MQLLKKFQKVALKKLYTIFELICNIIFITNDMWIQNKMFTSQIMFIMYFNL